LNDDKKVVKNYWSVINALVMADEERYLPNSHYIQKSLYIKGSLTLIVPFLSPKCWTIVGHHYIVKSIKWRVKFFNILHCWNYLEIKPLKIILFILVLSAYWTQSIDASI
jgi:hypothetical protein